MFTVQEILQATQGQLLKGNLKVKVKGVSTDTRTLKKGDLFIAVIGDNYDGHRFIEQAVNAGASAVMISRGPVDVPPDMPVILVPDTVKAYGYLARFHRRRFNVPLVAITGSAGKTTTKELITTVLSKKFKVLSNPGTENNQIGVPRTLLGLTKAHKAVVLEMGTNYVGDIAWLAQIAEPTVAVFTNIGQSHLAGLGSPEGVLKEKATLIDYLSPRGSVILNADDPLLRRLTKRKFSQKVITYGIDHKADIKAEFLKAGVKGIEVILGRGRVLRLAVPVWGNILNALAATACGEVFKINFSKIAKAIAQAKSPQGRQCFQTVKGITVIDDTYNANPVSFRNAIKTLSLLPKKGRLFLVAADMLELGDLSEQLHEEVGEEAGRAGIHKVLTIGRWAGLIGAGARRKNPETDARHFLKQMELINALKNELRPSDVLLVKGSRGMRMEIVVSCLVDHLKRGA